MTRLNKLAACLAASCAFTGALHAVELVWTNASGGNWDSAANWDPNQVPTLADTAIITNAGSFTVTADTSVSVGNLVIGDGNTNGAPTLAVSSTFSIEESAVIGTNAVVEFSGNLARGTVTNHGQFTWSSGTLSGTNDFVNAPDGHVFLGSKNTKNLRRPFQNFGLLEFNTTYAYTMRFRDSGTLTNHQTGEITFHRNVGFDLDSGSTADCILANYGTMTASGSGMSPSKIYVPFLNFGTFYVPGVCHVGKGTNYGTMNVPSASSQLFFTQDRFVMATGTELQGVGLVMAYNQGVLSIDAPVACSNHVGTAISAGYTPQFYLNATMTNWNGVSMSRGHFFITNPAVVLDTKSFDVGQYLTNAGSVFADNVTLDTSISSIHNSGTLTIRSNFVFHYGTLDQRPAGHLVTGAGCGTTLESKVNNSTRKLIGGLWDNYGTVSFPFVSSLAASGVVGWINHSNGVVNAGGNSLVSNSGGTNWFVNYGTLQRNGLASHPSWALVTTNYGFVLAKNTIMKFGDFWQISGITDLKDSDINTAQFHILGGDLRGRPNIGSGSSLFNNGDIYPGTEIGTLTIIGPLTNASGGTYHMEIGGDNPGNYDRIDVKDTAYLAGTLKVTFTNDFFPVIGNTFTAITYTALSGAFDQVVSPGYQFEVVYTSNALLLLSSNALPKVTLDVNPTQMVCNPFPIQASASDLDGSVTNLRVLMAGSPIAATAGNSLGTTVESDYPSVVTFTAEATDDRGGIGSASEQVLLTNLPLHTLMLGGFRGNQVFKICMVGEFGRDYDILATTNLSATNWTNLGLMETTNGVWRFFDSGATNFPRRFYEARQRQTAN